MISFRPLSRMDQFPEIVKIEQRQRRYIRRLRFQIAQIQREARGNRQPEVITLDGDSDDDGSDWPSPGLMVIIKKNGKAGVVRSVAPSACSVFIPDEEKTVNIEALHLAPVEPSRDDPVKVVLGAESRGMSGRVLSLDHEEQEGVVQLTSGDIKLFPLKNLCKTA